MKRKPKKYKTLKKHLRRECERQGIAYAVRWNEARLQSALDGSKPPAMLCRANTGRKGQAGVRQTLTKYCRTSGVDVSDRASPDQLAQSLIQAGTELCMPATCTCGKAVNMAGVIAKEKRRDPSMHTKTSTHAWDGVLFGVNACTCGQKLIVKMPLKARPLHCTCGRSFLMWHPSGAGICSRCK